VFGQTRDAPVHPVDDLLDRNLEGDIIPKIGEKGEGGQRRPFGKVIPEAALGDPR
jgi:hypothetical protein